MEAKLMKKGSILFFSVGGGTAYTIKRRDRRIIESQDSLSWKGPLNVI